MPRVYLSLGSNVDPEANLRLAVRELRSRLGPLTISTIYRNAPVGFDGDDFLNAVVGLDTELPPKRITRILKDLQLQSGRSSEQRGMTSRTLDIDLLLYDSLIVDREDLRLPRADVLRYDFVLLPLVELAPDYRHPVTGRTLAEHWREFAASPANDHPLTPVPIDF